MDTPLSPQMSPTTTDPTGRGGGGLDAPGGEGAARALHSGSEILGLKGFTCDESALASAMGLPVRKLAALRQKMARGVDWQTLPDGASAYAAASVPTLLNLLGLALQPVEIAALIAKSRRAETPEIMAKVRKFYANRHLMQVAWMDAKNKEHYADLVVTRRENFKPGMAVPIRLNHHGKYELARRSPRSKGRW